MDGCTNFLLPRSSYHGVMHPDNLVFNANLQEFSQRVSYICGLGNNGKLTPAEAFEKIQSLWQQLEHTRQGLSFDSPSSDR